MIINISQYIYIYIIYRYLRDYVSVKPQDYKAHSFLGDIYIIMNHPGIALGCYKR